ncbi:unnamed protein product [Camellia sinensis]
MKKETTYRLNPTFQINLQKHIIHGGVLPREPMPSNITVRLPSLEDLDAYAAEQWETTNFSSSLMKIFQRGLLSQRDKEPPKLTESGFQFLERGLDSADLISFMLELSFHVTGEAYNMNTLTDSQRNVIKDLADLGLVKLQQGRKESWFIPTKLATNLSISLSDTSSRKLMMGRSLLLSLQFRAYSDQCHAARGSLEGFVVVETNFRVYAYSTSKLHCEILRLFSRYARNLLDKYFRLFYDEASSIWREYCSGCIGSWVEYQLPNLIVAAITKENLYNAFENGIMAEQIISFLQQNAHPRVAERVPSVPENVTDQIRLWESDMNRVEITPAHFYDEFPTREVFDAACDFAREYGGLLWEDSKTMRLVVKAEILMHMRDFLRREKQ